MEEKRRKKKEWKKEKILTTVQRNNRNLSEELVSVRVSFKRAKSWKFITVPIVIIRRYPTRCHRSFRSNRGARYHSALYSRLSVNRLGTSFPSNLRPSFVKLLHSFEYLHVSSSKVSKISTSERINVSGCWTFAIWLTRKRYVEFRTCYCRRLKNDM